MWQYGTRLRLEAAAKLRLSLGVLGTQAQRLALRRQVVPPSPCLERLAFGLGAAQRARPLLAHSGRLRLVRGAQL